MATRPVTMPPPPKGSLGTIGGIAGGIVGGIYGGPAGALKGYQGGSAIGGVVGAMQDKPQGISVQSGSGPIAPQEQKQGLVGLIGQGASAYQGSKDLSSLSSGGAAPTSQTYVGEPSPQPGAMDRRFNKNQEDPVMNLTKAQKALAYQPEEVRKQYEPVINQALIQANRYNQRANYGSMS